MKNFMKWALIIVIINVVLGIIGIIIGHEVNPVTGERDTMTSVLGWIGMIAGIACVFLGIKERSNISSDDFTFGKGWYEGFLISVVASGLIAVWTYIMFAFLIPDFIDVMKSVQLTEMSKQGMTQEQIDQAKPFMDFMMSPTGFAISVFFAYVVGGMILSLIISPIVNAMKKPSEQPAI
jgi:hypothetical protein